MKKTLLAIGSIVTVAAPIAAVVSCGSKTTPKAHTQTTAQTDQTGLDAAKKIALKTWLHAAYPAIQTADLGEVTIQEGFDVSGTSHADYAISFAFNKDVNGLAIGGNTENVKDGSSLTFAAFKNKDIKLVLEVEGTKKEIAVSDSIKASVIQAAENQGFTFDAVPVKEEVKPEHIQVAETLGFTVGKETETISWNDATPSKVEGAGHFAVPHKVIPTSEETVQPQAYQLEITDTATPTELAIESAKARAVADAIIASEHARIENMATIAQRAAEEAKQREEAVFELTHPQTDALLNDMGKSTAPTPVGHKDGAEMPVLQWNAAKDLALITELTTGRWKVDFNLQARNEEYTAEELGLINVPTLSYGVTAHYFIESITGNKDVHVRVELHKQGEHRVFKNLDLQFGGRISSVEVDSNAKPELTKPQVPHASEQTAPMHLAVNAETLGFSVGIAEGRITNPQYAPTVTTQINAQLDREETARIFAQVKAEAEAQAIADANAEVWGMAAASLGVAAPMLDLTPATPVHVPQHATTNQDVMDLINAHLSSNPDKHASQMQESLGFAMMTVNELNEIYTLEKK